MRLGSNSAAHSELVEDLILAGSTNFSRLWKQPVGQGRAMRSDRVIRFGVPGMADCGGILGCGRRLEVEAKTGKGRLSDKQKRWKGTIERFRGVYLEARSVHALEELLDAHAGECPTCSNLRASTRPATVPPPPPPPAAND